MSYSKKLYRRKRNPKGLVSEHANPSTISARYFDYAPLRYFPKPKPQEATIKNCTVRLSGSSCSVGMGEVGVMARNEPTEALKNKKPRIHQQVVPYAPDLGIPSRYGGWVSPYEMVNRGRLGPSRIERKKKTYEYY